MGAPYSVMGTDQARCVAIRMPVASTFAERWIGTLRSELLDRAIIWNRRQLERLVVDSIDHHNTIGPSLTRPLLPISPDEQPSRTPRPLYVIGTTCCGDLVGECQNAA